MGRGRRSSFPESPTEVVVTSAADGGPGECRCELLTLDCLDAIACIPATRESLDRSIANGLLTRSMMKVITTFEDKRWAWSTQPIGKGIQYTTVAAWKEWTMRTQPLKETYEDQDHMFIKHNLYPDCVARNLKGKNCFFHPVSRDDYTDTIEDGALSWMEDNMTVGEQKAAATSIKDWLVSYRDESRSFGTPRPAVDHLLVFAQLARMHFNIRKPIVDSYARYHRIEIPEGYAGQSDAEPLRVSLHVRRADSCEHEIQGSGETSRYLSKASSIDSHAQVTGKRNCYETAVYMGGLRRVLELASGRPLEVYLSTDYAGVLLNEIRTEFKDLYDRCVWRFLDFPRETFDYITEIEWEENKPKHAFLGETAVDDLWHLSHGQVFVGHLGSRFGKMGWLLATAKYNTLIPYWTVDGRSYCCEIDEICSNATELIGSMEHCLTFAHDLAQDDADIDEDLENYWETGSSIRVKYVKRMAQRLVDVIRAEREADRLSTWLGSDAVWIREGMDMELNG